MAGKVFASYHTSTGISQQQQNSTNKYVLHTASLFFFSLFMNWLPRVLLSTLGYKCPAPPSLFYVLFLSLKKTIRGCELTGSMFKEAEGQRGRGAEEETSFFSAKIAKEVGATNGQPPTSSTFYSSHSRPSLPLSLPVSLPVSLPFSLPVSLFPYLPPSPPYSFTQRHRPAVNHLPPAQIQIHGSARCGMWGAGVGGLAIVLLPMVIVSFPHPPTHSIRHTHTHTHTTCDIHAHTHAHTCARAQLHDL